VQAKLTTSVTKNSKHTFQPAADLVSEIKFSNTQKTYRPPVINLLTSQNLADETAMDCSI